MKTNQELLDEANKIDFKITANGCISRTHSPHESGLFFIKGSIEVHGIDTYQYGSVQYINNATKVEIICPTHGSFFQKPNNHKDLQHKCPRCVGVHQPNTEEWVKKAREVHGDRYDYSLVSYKSTREKVEIICKEHGPFLQEANSHLSGKGCAKCSNKHQHTTEEWITLAKEVHGDKYDYSRVTYLHCKSKVEILCPDHGVFLQTPKDHVHGLHGCPKCAGQNQDILYLLKCKDTGWYKIGITTRSTKRRLRQIGGNMEEICTVVCAKPREHESILHKEYAQNREYNLYVDAGNTEFFSLNEDQVAKVRQYMASIAINQKSI